MKVGGGLNFVTGPMGAGKSLFAVRQLVHGMCNGKYCITNVELVDGWADRVARHVARFSSKAKRNQIAARLEHHYIFESDLAEARRYRLPQAREEGRGLFVWDEGHNDLNNRKWKDDGRAELLTWATQLRKLGFVGYLLTQHGDNTDAALRRIANHHIRLQNQREQTRFLGMRVSPWPLFLAYWYPAHLGLSGKAMQPVKTDRYFLTWHRHLYDTFGLFHGLDAADDEYQNLIWLPQLPRGGDVPRSGTRRKGLPAGVPATIDLHALAPSSETATALTVTVPRPLDALTARRDLPTA